MRAKTVLAFAVFAFSGCNAFQSAGRILGIDNASGQAATFPNGALSVPGEDEDATSVVGDSCRSADPNRDCLALKYVVYENPSAGKAVETQAAAIANVRAINSVWRQCNIGFQIEEFVSANPAVRGLAYHTRNYTDLDGIRNDFADSGALLVVTTGPWDRTGTLGQTSANAWTAMPGGPPYGSILEQPVGTFANIIAHELGHYLNLNHVNDVTDLMNPIIYDNSTKLTRAQCDTARAAISYFWSNMTR